MNPFQMAVDNAMRFYAYLENVSLRDVPDLYRTNETTQSILEMMVFLQLNASEVREFVPSSFNK